MEIDIGIENTVDELGIGLVIALLTPVLCCLLPARYQWKNLSDKEQLKIVICASIFIGNIDYIFDITVAKNWFEDGDVLWGAFICVSISISGLVSWYYRACHPSQGRLNNAKSKSTKIVMKVAMNSKTIRMTLLLLIEKNKLHNKKVLN